MNEAVIVSTARSPIGTAFKGSLVDVDAFELGTTVIAESVKRSASIRSWSTTWCSGRACTEG